MGPLKVTGIPKALPAEVIVAWAGAVKVTEPLFDAATLMLGMKVREPAMVKAAFILKVGLPTAPVQTILFAEAAVRMVTVLELAVNGAKLKITSSPAVGGTVATTAVGGIAFKAAGAAGVVTLQLPGVSQFPEPPVVPAPYQ